MSSGTDLSCVRKRQLHAFTNLILPSVFALVLAIGCRQSTSRKAERECQERSHFVKGQILTGKVVKVIDGDTVHLADSTNMLHKIRLQTIDAPESNQAFGFEAKQDLERAILNKEVTVQYDAVDRYCRIVGKVLINQRDVCLEQIRAGMAWHEKRYEKEQTAEDRDSYTNAEDDARASRRGLWRDPNPIDPYEFRHEKGQR